MEREVYRREMNRIERQFAQHNLEKDMAADYAAAFSKADAGARVRELKSANRALLVLLAVIAIVFAVVIAFY